MNAAASEAATGLASRKRLKDIIKARSYASGVRVILASGRESNTYFNMKPTVLDPEGAYLAASLLLDRITPLGPDYVGGLELGAVPIAAAIAAQSFSRGQPMGALIMRKAAKGHGTRQRLEGLGPGETLTGKRVVIVEDVTTMGGSALQAAAAARDAGAVVEQVVTILDREEGAGEMLAAEGLTLTSIFTAKDFTG
jgi:orotate phosphoribosyltransferase